MPRPRAARPRAGLRAAGLFAATLAIAIGCGGGASKGAASARAESPRVSRDVDPSELFPADLDLVVRVDLARMRAGLGPTATDAIAARALAESGEPEVKGALACADVVWIGARAAEIDSGDHVAIFEGKECMPDLARAKWGRVRSANARTAIFDRKGDAPRAGTARIINLGNRAVAFVSPVELDSVKRILDDGPDALRGNPRAEGVVSLDLRARPLSPALARRFPSFGHVAAGVDRVRASAVLVDEGVRIDAELIGRTREGADRAHRFLVALRDSGKEGRYAGLFGALTLEPINLTVRIKWVVPAKLVLALLTDRDAPAAEPPPAPAPQ